MMLPEVCVLTFTYFVSFISWNSKYNAHFEKTLQHTTLLDLGKQNCKVLILKCEI